MRSSSWRLLAVATLTLALGVTASQAQNAPTIPSWQIGAPVQNLQTQFEKFRNDGKMPSIPLLVPGTSSNYMFTAYSAGVNHPQGMAWYQNQQKWIIIHDTRAGYGKAMYVICSASKSDCSFHFIGKERHASGAQVIGDVLVIGVDGDSTYFVDLRDTKSPKQLPCKVDAMGTNFETSGAVGMAWHPGIKRFVLTIGSGGSDSLFVSNGQPLDSSSCKFVPVKSGNSYTKNLLHSPSEGLAQLYWDSSIKKLVAIGAAYEGDGQKLKFDSFNLVHVDNGGPDDFNFSDHSSPDDKLFDTSLGYANNPEPSFRWGGTSRIRSATEIEIIAASKTLTGGPAANFLKTSVFSSAETSTLSTYKVAIDCYHADLKNSGTDNTISVLFWAESELVKGVSRTGVSCLAVGSDPTWEIETSRPITKVSVKIGGNDAFYIDELRIYKNDKQVSWQGRDNGSGWCLSTQALDAKGAWAKYAVDNTCKSEWSFSF
jgi:hypothetical protein